MTRELDDLGVQLGVNVRRPQQVLLVQRGATLAWRGLRSVREVALRVRPTQGKVIVTLGGRVVGTRKIDRKIVLTRFVVWRAVASASPTTFCTAIVMTA